MLKSSPGEGVTTRRLRHRFMGANQKSTLPRHEIEMPGEIGGWMLF